MKTCLIKEFKEACKQQGINVKKVTYINTWYLSCQYQGQHYVVAIENNSFIMWPTEFNADSRAVIVRKKKIA